MTKEQKEELWAAINHYAVSCGGSPATRVYGNEARQRAVTRIERVVNAIELTWVGPIRCAECGGTDDAPLKVGCSGVIHDNEASEISLGSAATRNVAPEQNQAVTDCEPETGKSNGSEGKSASPPGKSAEVESLKRDNIDLAADYEGAWNRAQNNARLLYAILRWIDAHPDDPIPPQSLLLDAREAVRYAGVMPAWGERGEEAQGIPEKAANPPIDSPRGVAGDRCEVGNECGRAGCPECQQ